MEEGHKCARDESGGLSHSLLSARGIMSHRDLLHVGETTLASLLRCSLSNSVPTPLYFYLVLNTQRPILLRLVDGAHAKPTARDLHLVLRSNLL